MAILTHEAEVDRRSKILNSLLRTPHRKLADLDALHKEAIERDALFYPHLAVWYFDTKGNEVRDHKIAFVAHLITSDYPNFREVGWVLLQRLAPYEVSRVLDHCKKVIGKSPRILKSAITTYLREREADANKFDRAAMRMREDMTHLYASLRIKPSERAEQTLFQNNPPKDSPVFAVRALSRAETDGQRASIIIDNTIPYPVAVGALNAKTLSPVVMVALISVMTPQEVVNSLDSLTKRGAMDNKEVKSLIERKLKEAETDSRVSTFKAQRAASKGAVNEAVGQQLTSMMDNRVAAGRKITGNVAILVDRSGSMTKAIETAKELASLISAISDADLYVYAFDNSAIEVDPRQLGRTKPYTKSDWEAVFSRVRAGGSTSIGSAMQLLLDLRKSVDHIVIVTDERENSAPSFSTTYQKYVKVMGDAPAVTIVEVENPERKRDLELDRFRESLKAADITYQVFDFSKGDYYSLMNIVPLLTGGSKQDLVNEIMAMDLPQRPKHVPVALG